MATYDNAYSRFVGWTKLILPLAALALLSTMFLFSRASTNTAEIPFSEINKLAQKQQITAPTFSGVATDGSLITITAQAARPENGDLAQLSITEPELILNASDGTNLTILAGVGEIDSANSAARLSGLARLETSSGYKMETTELIADLNTGTVDSLGPLAIIAPFGEITAGLVRIEIGENGSGQQMHFTEGVNMIYTPQITQ